MRAPAPQPHSLPEAEQDWLRRFFWYRGFGSGKLQVRPVIESDGTRSPDTESERTDVLDFVVRRSILLAGEDMTHAALQRAAIAILEGLLDLMSRRAWIEGVARQRAGLPDDVEDLAQVVLVKAILQQRTYEIFCRPGSTEEQKKAWLRRILFNQLIDWRRHKSAVTISLDTLVETGIPLVEILSSTDPTVEGQVTNRLVLQAIQDFLDLRLRFSFHELDPEAYRLRARDVEVARLRWFNAASPNEIATQTNISLPAVSKTISKVRGRLLDWLKHQKSLPS